MAEEEQGKTATEREAAEAGAREELPQEELLMRLAPGERFYKFYILTEPMAKEGQRMEHRILSKQHADGSIEMVSYNAWVADGQSEKRDFIRVPSLSRDLFEQLVTRVREQSGVPDEAIREIDLSRCASVDEQLRLLAQHS